MSIYKDVLQKYWGYPDFRPLQEDIIKSVADDKKDTLGLLPTGGGKSIIFQVPALAHKGMCIVVSPLIALMKDQVENLKKRNIPAAAVYTGMSRNEISMTLEKAINGKFKFLYLSPERLGTELFLNHLQEMKINLLAIDEAHCISQWGYDFRPSYLKVADVRKYIPNVPVLALTATATPKVVEDIQEKLNFKQKNVLRKSFERKNLIYIVRKTNDKYGQLLKLINAIPGTGVVYVRSRKMTEKVADYLKSHGISADFYHAGLDPKQKDRKQDDWKNDRTRVIVSTNAFGMGIDKPDVRFVIHIDLADSLEAYFQEAGRGGRDLKDAYAFLLFDDADIEKLIASVDKSYPPKEKIFAVYKALANYFKIPVGGGKGQSFEFVLSKFSQNFDFFPLEVYNSLKFLQKQGLIEYTDEVFTRSKIHILMSRKELYKFQVENPAFDSFIKFLLRSFPGLFTDFVPIDELWIANSTHTQPKIILDLLRNLHKFGVLEYSPRKTTPFITFLEERIHPKSFHISKENYDFLKENYIKRINAVVDYATRTDKCRSRLLLEYFGEYEAENCGRCDICHSRKNQNSKDNYKIQKQIIDLLFDNAMNINELEMAINDKNIDVKKIVRRLVDDGVLRINQNRKFEINKKI